MCYSIIDYPFSGPPGKGWNRQNAHIKEKLCPLRQIIVRSILFSALFTSALSTCAAESVVATRLEPHHHVILENKYVTVMRVLIQPGNPRYFMNSILITLIRIQKVAK